MFAELAVTLAAFAIAASASQPCHSCTRCHDEISVPPAEISPHFDRLFQIVMDGCLEDYQYWTAATHCIGSMLMCSDNSLAISVYYTVCQDPRHELLKHECVEKITQATGMDTELARDTIAKYLKVMKRFRKCYEQACNLRDFCAGAHLCVNRIKAASEGAH